MKEKDYANGKVEYQSNFRKLLGTAVSNDSEALAGLQLPRAFCFLGFLMEKAPAFQFYASDFLSDENVILMDNRAVGCYIKLLCVNWKQGSIPSDIEKIARLCGEDGSAMAQLWPSLESCFISGNNGRLINPRIEKERLKQQRFRKERSAAGKKGARNRWKDKDKNGSAIDLPMAKNGSSSSSSSSSSLNTKKPEPYRLPSKEEITESSVPKLKTDIGKLCEELYQQKIFPKVHAFANQMLKKTKNPRAIIHALSRCMIHKPKKPWAYCLQIMKVENGNYNERDHQKNT